QCGIAPRRAHCSSTLTLSGARDLCRAFQGTSSRRAATSPGGRYAGTRGARGAWSSRMTPLRFFYSESEIYESTEPAFYDATAIPAVRHILAHYDTIQAELADYLDGRFTIRPLNPS